MQWPKDSLFNKWSWDNWIATCKQMKLDLSKYLSQSITPLTIINSKKDWRLKFHDLTIKLLEENIMGNKCFFEYDTKSTVLKKNAKTTYEIGENLCKTYIHKEVNIWNL